MTRRLAVAAMAALLVYSAYVIHQQRQTINALIDLNHDKSVYIDAGCPGRYQGTEELLPRESTQ